LVIYTSDHGEMLFSHSLMGKGAAMYDEITRIPLIMRWPGQTPAGAVCGHPVSHIDLVPSILEVFGLPTTPTLAGNSVLATIKDPAVRSGDAIFMEFGRYEVEQEGFGGFQPSRAVFDGRYKLVINLVSDDELYDLSNDPHELTNLIQSADHARIRDGLHDRVLKWMSETSDPFRGYAWQHRPWRSDAPPPAWAGSGRPPRGDPSEPARLDYWTGLPIRA
jgi:uncharacterized sulfatase